MLKTKITKFFSQLSTKPNYESYTWGNQHSIFALIIYRLVYVARMFSPLQWCKTLWRKLNDKPTNNSRERKDFHALYTEYYLALILAFSLTVYYSQPYIQGFISTHYPLAYDVISDVKYVVVTWLLIESILWVTYYMLLRILIENRLSIFNEAEYFIALPFVLFTQIIFFASLGNVTLAETTAALFNLPIKDPHLTEQARLAIGLLGYMYTALIIANIINLIPAIPVWHRPNITIIGAGDVVEQRILPALLDQKFYHPKQLSITSDNISESFKITLDELGVDYFEVNSHAPQGKVTFAQRNKVRQDIVNYVTKRSSYAIIATPTAEHFPYMTALAKEQVIFAVEKPIISTRAELIAMNDYGDNIMKNGFLLSYYWLEKALPLNYFLSLNAHYRDFLEISSESNPDKYISQTTLAYIRERLGNPTKITIKFYEKEESRLWALLKETGGFYYETFIHPMTLLYNVLGKKIALEQLNVDWYLSKSAQQKFQQDESELGASFIHLYGQVGQCLVDIKSGKFTDIKERSMFVEFESGRVDVNLDSMSCFIKWNNGGKHSSTSIRMKDEYQKPYSAQMKLYDLFIHEAGNWTGQRFDDYPSQNKVLENMVDILRQSNDVSSFYNPKVIDSVQLAALIGK
jgi:predicted dehydrogenase